LKWTVQSTRKRCLWLCPSWRQGVSYGRQQDAFVRPDPSKPTLVAPWTAGQQFLWQLLIPQSRREFIGLCLASWPVNEAALRQDTLLSLVGNKTRRVPDKANVCDKLLGSPLRSFSPASRQYSSRRGGSTCCDCERVGASTKKNPHLVERSQSKDVQHRPGRISLKAKGQRDGVGVTQVTYRDETVIQAIGVGFGEY
jgi:hypothetical protein